MSTSSNKISDIWQRVKKSLLSENASLAIVVFGLIAIIVAATVFLICGSWSFSVTLDESKIGQFGDFVGGIIGTVFALASVILYYVALNEQRKDLQVNQKNLEIQNNVLKQQIDEFQAQEEEMKSTRKVYEEQTELFKEQTRIYRYQQFDSSFYSLLNLVIQTQKDYHQTICIVFNNLNGNYSTNSLTDTYGVIKTKCVSQYNKYSNELNRLFGTIRKCIELIAETSFKPGQKQHYIEILQAQIDEKTLLLIYYYSFTPILSSNNSLFVKNGLFQKMSVLDKLETLHLYQNSNKIMLSQFLSQLSATIVTFIDKFTDLSEEEPSPINAHVRAMGLTVTYGIEVDGDDIKIILEFVAQEWDNLFGGNYQNTFDKLLSIYLLDIRYLSKLCIPKEKILKTITGRDENKLSFCYKLKIN